MLVTRRRRARTWVVFAALVGCLTTCRFAAAAAPSDAGARPDATAGPAAFEELQVGYVDLAPLAWNRNGNPSRPVGYAVDVLEHLAREEGWRLRYRKLSEDSVLAGLAARKLHLGIVPSQPGRQWLPWVRQVAHSAPYLQTVAAVAVAGLEPSALEGDGRGASFSDDGMKPSRPAALIAGASRWAAALLPALLIGVVGVLLLSGLTALANLRLPRARGRWPESFRFVALDPTVAAGRQALRWLWASRSGRVLAGVWFVGCAAATLVSCPPRPAGPTVDEAHLIEALRKVASSSELVGLRPDDTAVVCADSVVCLEDLNRGHLKAVAGDADRICHDLRREHLDEIHFIKGYVWPRQYRFLAPSGSQTRRQLDAALLRMHLEQEATLRQISKRYGLAWDPPTLARTCPHPEAGL